jgi:hypothetical protein
MRTSRSAGVNITRERAGVLSEVGFRWQLDPVDHITQHHITSHHVTSRRIHQPSFLPSPDPEAEGKAVCKDENDFRDRRPPRTDSNAHLQPATKTRNIRGGNRREEKQGKESKARDMYRTDAYAQGVSEGGAAEREQARRGRRERASERAAMTLL